LGEISQRDGKVPNVTIWYGRQLVSVLSSRRLTLLLAAMVCLAILITNLLLPLVGIRLPEGAAINEVCFGGAALIWVFAGFIAYRRRGIVNEGLQAGATISLVTMTTAMLTFTLIHPSGSSLAPFTLLPLFALVGAICGALGAALARFTTSAEKQGGVS